MNIDNDIYRKWLEAETDEDRAGLEAAAKNRNEIYAAFEFLGNPVNPLRQNAQAEDIDF